ncbi:MAG TPA: AAA family ATPase [Microlunatus sp.]
MTKILLVSATPDLEAFLAAASNGFLPFRYDQLPDTAGPVLEQLAGLPFPDVIVLDGVADPARAIALAASLTDPDPMINIIMISDQEAELALAALRAGVRDIVAPTVEPDELRAVIERATHTARYAAQASDGQQPIAHQVNGRVITVVSPKGGVGKTTIATNLAVGIAARFPRSTVLVDLDIQFGDVGSALDLEPEYFLPDMVQGQAQRDPMALKTILTEHSTGLYVICAPDSPVDADSISGEDVAQLLQMLASEFRYVVVDTAPGLSEHTLAALDQTSDLILVSSMEVPGVRGLRKELDTLDQLKLLNECRQVVINLAEPRGLLSIADIEATIKTSVDHQLPRSKAATDAVNQGVPLLQSGVRDPLTKQLRALVANVLANSETPPPSFPPESDQTPRVRPRRAASRWSRTKKLVAG